MKYHKHVIQNQIYKYIFRLNEETISVIGFTIQKILKSDAETFFVFRYCN